jgi:hypothetical protein
LSVSQALFIAFFSYIHLISLVLPEDRQEGLGQLWFEHSPAFTTPREDGNEVETPQGNPEE